MFTLGEAARLLRERRLSSLELTQACLANIERLNPALNAFITVTAESALQHAKQADAERAAGNDCGPLHGIPIAIKDLIDVAGVPTTAASRQFLDHVPAEDAEIVLRLNQAGAVIVGKTNLHEFAFGGSGMVSAYGPVRNPWDTDAHYRRFVVGFGRGRCSPECALPPSVQTPQARCERPPHCAASSAIAPAWGYGAPKVSSPCGNPSTPPGR